MRQWAITHRAEFGWLFARPAPKYGEQRPDSPEHRAAIGFERVCLEEMAAVWDEKPFPVPDLEELDPSLREQLRAFSDSTGGRLSPEVSHVFLTCWIRLYGLLCMEVLNQLGHVFADLEPVFEECLREIADRLGMPYEPPD